MAIDTHKLAESIERVMEFLQEIVSVESDNSIGGIWERTHLQRADNGDLLYRAEADKKQLLAYRADAKLTADIIRQQSAVIRELVRVIEKGSRLLAPRTEMSLHLKHEVSDEFISALRLSAPLVKKEGE